MRAVLTSPCHALNRPETVCCLVWDTAL